MDYILSIHRVLLYKNINPVNGFCPRAWLCKILILYGFFPAKTSHFPRRFPYRSRRGGNLPPAGTRERSHGSRAAGTIANG